MTRYYFDMRDDRGTAIDEEGLDLLGLMQVQEEAARSLADMARDATPPNGLGSDEIVIEVRNDSGPVLQARFTFEIA
jgi:hypothetical protein